jgi:hypothetical protein
MKVPIIMGMSGDCWENVTIPIPELIDSSGQLLSGSVEERDFARLNPSQSLSSTIKCQLLLNYNQEGIIILLLGLQFFNVADSYFCLHVKLKTAHSKYIKKIMHSNFLSFSKS